MMFAYELNSCLLILTKAYYCWGFCHIITQIISIMFKIIPSIPTANTPFLLDNNIVYKLSNLSYCNSNYIIYVTIHS